MAARRALARRDAARGARGLGARGQGTGPTGAPRAGALLAMPAAVHADARSRSRSSTTSSACPSSRSGSPPRRSWSARAHGADLPPEPDDARAQPHRGQHRRAHRPAQPPRAAGRPRGRAGGRHGRRARVRWSCSTSTASRTTTTASATSPATSCLRASGGVWTTRSARAGPPTGSAATSSACVLRPGLAGTAPPTVAAATALCDEGDGFIVKSSFGQVLLPTEANSVTAALQLADQRMYAHKHGGRGGAVKQTTDVLLSTLREREPDLHDHLEGVDLACGGGRRARWACPSPTRPTSSRAAELHDIGKIAIPDAILRKPGPLDAAEWEFMRAPHDHRRAHPDGGAGAAVGRQARALQPRALGRPGLSRRARGHGHPARRPHRQRLRRLRRDDRRPPLPQRHAAERGARPSCAAARARSSTRTWSRSSAS